MLLGRWPRARVRGPARPRLEHGRLRRGPLPLRRARRRRARARARPTTSTPAASSRPARRAAARSRRSTVPEDAPLDPRNVYAATKLAQEHLCGAFARETGVPVTALRYHNVYGPRMPRDTPYAGVASIFRTALAARPRRRGSSRTAASGATSSTSATSRAPTCSPSRPTAPVAGAFNVASGTPRTVVDMARALAAALRRRRAAGGHGGVARRRRPPRLRLARARARERSASRAAEDFAAGMREFADRAAARAGRGIALARAGTCTP